METDVAVDHNEKALREMLMNIREDVRELLKVDYDQVQWEIIGEISQVANSILLILTPESRDD